MVSRSALAPRILAWQAKYGRSGLPWQGTQEPYKVWLSEIMLQQTQVTTVLEYYPRFLKRFDSVGALAAATQDEVLALWSGLGYYSRARNLHRCAMAIVAEHGGCFPKTATQLQSLPGIGRSTAAAIAAFCYGERVAILDANVKRVLTRVLGFAEDLARQSNERLLWDLATDLLPTESLTKTMPRHTQGMMDLGATVCTSRNPACHACPVSLMCVAFKQGRPEDYPVKTRKLKRSTESWWLLWIERHDGATWLVQRPSTGIWASLYCLPMNDTAEGLASIMDAGKLANAQTLPVFKHVLTHKDLYLHVLRLDWKGGTNPTQPGQWVHQSALVHTGLPAPIRKLLEPSFI